MKFLCFDNLIKLWRMVAAYGIPYHRDQWVVIALLGRAWQSALIYMVTRRLGFQVPFEMTITFAMDLSWNNILRSRYIIQWFNSIFCKARLYHNIIDRTRYELRKTMYWIWAKIQPLPKPFVWAKDDLWISVVSCFITNMSHIGLRDVSL